MNKKNQEVEASLIIEVNVDCPCCGDNVNLMDEFDTNDYNHNEEGHVICQACPDNGYWMDAHKDFSVSNVTCTWCKCTFDVEGLNW